MTTVCSTFIGFAVYGGRVFDSQHPAFGFIVYGAIGGIIFSSFRYMPSPAPPVVIVMAAGLNAAISQLTDWMQIYIKVLFVAAIAGAIYVFEKKYFERLQQMRIARIMVFASLIAVAYIVVALVLDATLLASSKGVGLTVHGDVYYNLADGFFLGIGLGLGSELSQILVVKSKRGEN